MAAKGLANLNSSPGRNRAKPMMENEKYLKEAHAHAKEFEAQPDPEGLSSACMALDNVVLVQEPDPKIRGRLRKEALVSWLHLLELMDRFLDPNFDPKDVPEKLFHPPPVQG